jgi:hypothetical protein
MGRLIAAMAMVCIAACSRAPAPPEAVNGTLDLRGWHVEGAPLRLGTRWSFWWKKVVSDDPRTAKPTPDAETLLVNWNGLPLPDGSRATGFGYATYQLALSLPDQVKNGEEQLALRTGEADSASRITVRDSDGVLLAQLTTGEFATDPSKSRPMHRFDMLRFTTRRDVLITLYVSNWEKAYGGPWSAPIFGTATDLDTSVRRQRAVDFGTVGLLVMIAIHHLVMFVLRPRERAPLWFALLCLDMALRTLLTRHYFETEWNLPSLWPYLLRANFLTFYCAVPLFAAFSADLFPRYMPRRGTLAFLAATVPFVVAALLLPPVVFTAMLSYFHLLTLVSIVAFSLILLRAVVQHHDVLPLIMLLGFSVTALTVVYDIAIAHGTAGGLYVSQYGSAAFVVFQSLLLAIGRDRDRRALETRNSEVQTLNESLRRQISDRAHQLQQALMLLGSGGSKDELELGQKVAGRYRIVAPIGQGGMGQVYEAERLDDRRRVALKVLRGPWKPQTLARFAREAQLVASISHPNVIAIEDMDITSQGEFFLVMELLAGASLESHRDHFGNVAWALPILRQLVCALEAIHRRGVVHRDLKPGNILIDGAIVKVADFGIAGLAMASLPSQLKSTVDGANDTAEADVKLTRAGTFLGSPLYMAPELVGGAERASARSDVFSFGLVAYELVTGRRPFPRAVVLERADGRIPPPPIPVVELAPSLPAEVGAAIDRCLVFEPVARPDAATLRTLLDER